MKLRILGIFSLLVGITFLTIGCPSKSSSPSAPAAPTATNTFTATYTVCTDGSGHTCTPTFSATPSNTATVTPTSTPSDTATTTDTYTITNTPTNSATSTNSATPTNSLTSTATFTITNTPTITPTFTITETPTNSGTPTQTGTPTNTFPSTPTGTPTNTFQFTPSSTPTNSPTATKTATPVFTSTPTPAPYIIKGTVQYTGGNSPTGKNLVVYATTNISNGNGVNWSVPAQTGAVSYTLNLPSTGSYIVLAFWTADSTLNNGSPSVGDPYTEYTTGGTAVCLGGSPTTITISAPVTDTANISFGNSCELEGVSGPVTYTGVGAVNGNTNLSVQGYADSNYLTPVAYGTGVSVNGGTYSLLDTNNASSVYIQAWLNSNSCNGNCGNGPVTGDPVTNLGSFSPFNSNTTNHAITLSDANLYGTTSSLSGTVNWTGSGSVNSTNPIVITAYVNNGSNTQNYASCVVTTNGGTYFMGVTTGNYYVTEQYVTDPTAYAAGGGGGNNIVGSYGQNSDGTCIGSGSGPNGFGAAIAVSGAAVSNLSFSGSCGQFYGYLGTVTYTGSKGTPNCNGSGYGNSMYIVPVNGTAESSFSTGNSQNVCNNGQTFATETGTTSQSYYLRVWFDSNSVGCCTPAAGEPWTVVGPYANSTNPSSINITFDDSSTW